MAFFCDCFCVYFYLFGIQHIKWSIHTYLKTLVYEVIHSFYSLSLFDCSKRFSRFKQKKLFFILCRVLTDLVQVQERETSASSSASTPE